jgi:hypothetical protein
MTDERREEYEAPAIRSLASPEDLTAGSAVPDHISVVLDGQP